MQLNGSINNLLCVFYKYLPMYFMNLHVSGKLENNDPPPVIYKF